MSQRRAYVDSTMGNCLVSEIMIELRRSSEQGCDSYVNGVDGMVSYFIDEVMNTVI